MAFTKIMQIWDGFKKMFETNFTILQDIISAGPEPLPVFQKHLKKMQISN